MANETPTITGETRVITITTLGGGLLAEKLTKVNRKLAKQGLGQCKVLGCEICKVSVAGEDGEEQMLTGYRYSIQIPFASKKIEGYTLVGTIEDLGKGQSMLSGIAVPGADQPVFPQQARYDELENLVYATEDVSREINAEYQTVLAAYQEFCRTTLAAYYEALKTAANAKLESLRGAKLGCIHCNTTRARKSVLVFERENGELVMVGRSCAKEFFGIDLAAALAVHEDLMGEDTESYRSFNASFSSNTYRRQFAMVYWLVKNFGYVSPKVEDSYNSEFVPKETLLAVRKSTRTMVYEMERKADHCFCGVSAADFLRATDPSTEVRTALFDEVLAGHADNSQRFYSLDLLKKFHDRGDNFETSQDELGYAVRYFRWLYTHEDKVAQALADCTNFWLGVESTDTFMQNCKAVAVAEVNKSIGMTGMVVLKWLESFSEVQKGAFFVPAHRRMFPKEPAQKYLAPKGEMVNVTITVTKKMVGGYEDQPWYMVVGRTSENLEVQMFCKKDMFDEAEEGKELKLRAKVKDHKVYKGMFSTQLYYAKVLD